MKSTALISSSVLLLLLSTAFTYGDASWRAPRFGDMYDCFIICDAEVSAYADEDYEQVDSDELADGNPLHWSLLAHSLCATMAHTAL